jgi:hypothetical protein
MSQGPQASPVLAFEQIAVGAELAGLEILEFLLVDLRGIVLVA